MSALGSRTPEEARALRDDARSLMQAIGPQHSAANARRYKWVTHIGEPSENMLGMRVDPQPFEGKVVYAASPWAVLKTGRSDFALVHEDLLPVLPDMGATVRIEPYARRNFDGTRIDAPKVETHTRADGTPYQTKTLVIGANHTPLPIEKPANEYLRDLVELVERGKAPDGLRTIAQMLVDAKARDFITMDPDDEQVFSMPPSIRFEVETTKFAGEVEIAYEKGADYYRLRIGDEQIDDVDFESVAPILFERIDDGQWRQAKVEILKPAPRASRRMAA